VHTYQQRQRQQQQQRAARHAAYSKSSRSRSSRGVVPAVRFSACVGCLWWIPTQKDAKLSFGHPGTHHPAVAATNDVIAAINGYNGWPVCIQLTKCQVCGLVAGPKKSVEKLAAAPASCLHMGHGSWREVRAVQSPPFPPRAAARRRGGPGGGLGTPGLAPPRLGPICEKSRFQDVKPTLLQTPQSYKPPGEPGAPEEPPSYRSWVPQLEVADWVSFGRLKLRRLRPKTPSR
jgi:hypothetical protein